MPPLFVFYFIILVHFFSIYQEPKIIGKYNRNVDGMEEKILSLYACGMSQRDIAEQIKNLYDVEISPELVSKISEKLCPM